MNPSQKQARHRHGNPPGCRAAGVIGLVLIGVLLTPRAAAAAEGSGAEAAAEPKVTGGEEGGDRAGRRAPGARRDGRAAGDEGSTQRQRKRTAEARRERRARRAARREAGADDAPVRLHLQGTFELDLGAGRVMRGEGSSTIELDRKTVEQWTAAIGQGLDEAGPIARDLLGVIVKLPQTVETTGEILKSLTDPETQKQLQQVEQLLRLMRQSEGEATEGRSDEATKGRSD